MRAPLPFDAFSNVERAASLLVRARKTGKLVGVDERTFELYAAIVSFRDIEAVWYAATPVHLLLARMQRSGRARSEEVYARLAVLLLLDLVEPAQGPLREAVVAFSTPERAAVMQAVGTVALPLWGRP